MYKIYPLKVAESVEPEPRIFYLGDCSKTIKLYTYFWLVVGEREKILVDTGFTYEDGRNVNPEIKQQEGEEPISQLKKHNISPEDISHIIITHVHWDHLSPVVEKFTNAKIYIQKKDVKYALKPPHPWFSKFIFLDTLKKLKKEYKDRLNLISKDGEILPGISVLFVGGHTPGSQAVKIKTNAGNAIICGDVVFTYRNIENDVPVGFNSNLEECFLAMERFRKEADIILPNHDPEVLARYGEEIG
jgi:glyoxylase-like metal-dependent hydrolase (beta-lactamase superfamily II)